MKLVTSNVSSSNRKSKHLILVIVCIAIILVAASVGAYYFTQPSGSTDDTAVPTNFNDGAYANYNIIVYNPNGSIYDRNYMNTSITAGTYSGVDCWVYVQNYCYNNETGTCNELSTLYLNKTTYNSLHITIEYYTNGVLTEQKAFNPGESGFDDDLPRFQSFNTTARDQSVTVPAGTFSCIQREGTVIDKQTGEAYYKVQYLNDSVPGWGIVKHQDYQGDVLLGEYVLVNYGN